MRVLWLLPLAFCLQFVPPALAEGDLQKIVVISDLNGRYGSTGYHPRIAKAVARIVELAPDLVISTGDMVAGQRPSPKLKRDELEAMWANFHQQVRIPLEQAGIPLVSTPGNHDASGYPGYELERKVYADYHAAHPPAFTPDKEGRFPYYFSTVINDLLLISLDATRASPLDEDQHQWLKRQLCGSEQKTMFVFGHLPLQAITRGRERDVISDPRLENLLAATGVAAYLSGHHHAFYPGSRMGIDMLSIGNLGGNQRRLVGTSQTTGFSFALIEIDAQKKVQISAYAGTDFSEAIDITRLPPYLGAGTRRLNRRDLVDDGIADDSATHASVCTDS